MSAQKDAALNLSPARKRVFAVLLAAVMAMTTLLVSEVFLRTIKANVPTFEGTRLLPLIRRLEAPELSWWEQRFVDHYKKGAGEMVFEYSEGLHRSHPTRGWTPKPNIRTGMGIEYTTNGQGWRSLYEFENDAQRYQVIIVGDSFTYGDEVGDSYTWPHLLQRLDERLNVLNMAVTGYGIDQMYLTLSETAADFAPRLVIAAFIGDDLNRSLLDFRDYKKPRFVLDASGELELTNTPIAAPADVYRELQETRRRSRLEVINLVRSIWRSRNAVVERKPSWFFLNEKLFAKMDRIAEQQGAEFLMLYLPSGREMTDPLFSTPGEGFFTAYQKRHDHLFLNLRPALLEAPFSKAEGHYGPNETALISHVVHGFIRQLSSWKDFVESRR